jgi:endonuclease YncB( thermonuclease family)
MANDSNDGDSFHVRAQGKEYVFRLYFVDTPETDLSFPERVKDQGEYFGLTRAQTLQLGRYAEQYTKEELNRPFTIRTCMQAALGRSKLGRIYAFVETADGDLGELLVANGMARVHGTEAMPVGLSSPRMEEQKLQRLEREAKAEKVGAWGASGGRLIARAPKQPSKTGVDSFDAFFHPERVAAASDLATVPPTPDPNWPFPPRPTVAPQIMTTRPASTPPAATQSAATAKLDANTASEAELIALPNIGPAKAASIIAARPFKSADDLRNVKGIGPKIYEKIRPYFGAP